MQKTQSSSPKPVIRKLGQSYASWFQPSKSFVLLEEPAFDVYQLYTEGHSLKHIISVCNEKYNHLDGNITTFTREIIEKVQYLNNPENAVSVSLNPEGIKSVPATLFSEKTYKMGDKTISVRYQNEYLEFSLHPLFAHLADTETQNPEHQIELFENSRMFFFRYNGQIMDAFRKKDIEYFAGSVKQQIYSILFDRDYNAWMMTLHASGVVQNGEAILFSAAAGSGKSTISAILKAHGFEYLSDDFIAADGNGKVYPFPASISVKEGASKRLSEFYPELKEKDVELAFTGKKVKYIPVHNQKEIDAAPFPVKALVFINFNSNKKFDFEEVEKREAIQLLLRETWVKPEAENVSLFFDWIENTQFYRLTYSKTGEALEAVEKIFAL